MKNSFYILHRTQHKKSIGTTRLSPIIKEPHIPTKKLPKSLKNYISSFEKRKHPERRQKLHSVAENNVPLGALHFSPYCPTELSPSPSSTNLLPTQSTTSSTIRKHASCLPELPSGKNSTKQICRNWKLSYNWKTMIYCITPTYI